MQLLFVRGGDKKKEGDSGRGGLQGTRHRPRWAVGRTGLPRPRWQNFRRWSYRVKHTLPPMVGCTNLACWPSSVFLLLPQRGAFGSDIVSITMLIHCNLSGVTLVWLARRGFRQPLESRFLRS
eukprot:1178008-Prorocentrum_minimum.AAC.2